MHIITQKPGLMTFFHHSYEMGQQNRKGTDESDLICSTTEKLLL